MSTIKLYYFGNMGRARPICNAFKLGGVEYELVTINREIMMKMKESGDLPFGQVPVLEVNGVKYAQSSAQLRYAGKLANIYPADPLEALKVDMIGDCCDDITAKLLPSMYEKDEDKKKAMREELASSTLPPMFEKLDALVGAGGYVSGTSVTTADLMVHASVAHLKSGMLDNIPTTLIDAYPNLMAVYGNVETAIA